MFGRTIFFGVYKYYGPRVATVVVSWVHELTPKESRPFFVKSYVNGRNWIQEPDASKPLI